MQLMSAPSNFSKANWKKAAIKFLTKTISFIYILCLKALHFFKTFPPFSTYTRVTKKKRRWELKVPAQKLPKCKIYEVNSHAFCHLENNMKLRFSHNLSLNFCHTIIPATSQKLGGCAFLRPYLSTFHVT